MRFLLERGADPSIKVIIILTGVDVRPDKSIRTTTI